MGGVKGRLSDGRCVGKVGCACDKVGAWALYGILY